MGAETELLSIVRDLGIRSVLAIPLLSDDTVLGAFTINTEPAGGFTDSQVALLQTFAEQ
jgi:GAF domain-containing protein